MNEPHLPPDADSSVNLEKIKAGIRGKRFARRDPWGFTLWGMLLGAILCPVLLVGRIAILGNGASQTSNFFVDHALYMGTIAIFVGGGLGLAITAIGVAIFVFLRPSFVALFRTPADFEREYGDGLPRVR